MPSESNTGPRTVLVCGGTGRQGGAVVDELMAETGHDIHVLTRSPDGEHANRLRERGVTIVSGDYADPDSLDTAFDGVDLAFFLTDHRSAGGVDGERRQGAAVISAAESAGVDHLVYSSTVDADVASDVPHFAAKADIETMLAESAVPGTVLRPSSFFQNFADLQGAVRTGFLPYPLAVDAPVPMFDVRDIGRATVEVFSHTSMHTGAVHDLCAGLYTLDEIADAMGTVGATPVTPISIPRATVQWMEDESIAQMFRWYNRRSKSHDAPVTTLDIDLRSLDTYLSESGLVADSSLLAPFGRLVARVSGD